MKYEGDYRCEAHEGEDHCHEAATQVWREPYTPASFKVTVCDEHSADCRDFGYRRDWDAEAQLARDKERERLADQVVFPVEHPKLRSLLEARLERSVAIARQRKAR